MVDSRISTKRAKAIFSVPPQFTLDVQIASRLAGISRSSSDNAVVKSTVPAERFGSPAPRHRNRSSHIHRSGSQTPMRVQTRGLGCRGASKLHGEAAPRLSSSQAALSSLEAEGLEAEGYSLESVMSTSHAETEARLSTTTFSISADESAREAALRGYFADFWGTAQGAPRAIFDRFIAACPIADDVSAVLVNDRGVAGWWLRPNGEGQAERAILLLHGGSYMRGSAKASRGLASQIASRTRVPVLVIDYPLAPEAVLPAALEAALTAWRWLLSTGVTKIAIVGDSAGGGLALATLAALRHATDRASAVAGVTFSAWVDLAFTGRSMTDPKVEDPLLAYDRLRDSAQTYLGGADPRDPRGSPLFGELAGLPPLLMQVGTDERLLDDSRQYAEKAAAAGVPVRLEVWQGMHHVFQLNVASLESSRLALDRAAAFLTEAFSRG